jgi:hypothetical protein
MRIFGKCFKGHAACMSGGCHISDKDINLRVFKLIVSARMFTRYRPSVTLGYTAGYLPTDLRTVRLCDCVVQAPWCRREAVGLTSCDQEMLSVFMS